MKLNLKDVEGLKALMTNSFNCIKEIELIKKTYKNPTEEVETTLTTQKEQLATANEIINGFAENFVVPIPTLIKKLNEYFEGIKPRYSIEYGISDDDYDPDKFFYAAYLSQDDKEIGTLFVKSYFHDDFVPFGGHNKKAEEYIKTSKDKINCINTMFLFKSSKMLESNLNEKIIDLFDRPSLQQVLWNMIEENIKQQTEDLSI